LTSEEEVLIKHLNIKTKGEKLSIEQKQIRQSLNQKSKQGKMTKQEEE